MTMRCRRVISHLNAYADGELTQKSRRTIRNHLAGCETCRKRLEDIHGLEAVLTGTLPVPPVPDGFTAGVLAAAQNRIRPAAAPRRILPSIITAGFRWIAEISAPMRIAACVTVLLAVAAGWSLNGGRLTGGGMRDEPNENLYGIEWFDPAPPGSIGSSYIAVTTGIYGQVKGQ